MSRIKWEQSSPWYYTGLVGGQHLFAITNSNRPLIAGRPWKLVTLLPGMETIAATEPEPDGLATLQRVAEGWLRDFVAGLGAAFPEERVGHE